MYIYIYIVYIYIVYIYIYIVYSVYMEYIHIVYIYIVCISLFDPDVTSPHWQSFNPIPTVYNYALISGISPNMAYVGEVFLE